MLLASPPIVYVKSIPRFFSSCFEHTIGSPCALLVRIWLSYRHFSVLIKALALLPGCKFSEQSFLQQPHSTRQDLLRVSLTLSRCLFTWVRGRRGQGKVCYETCADYASGIWTRQGISHSKVCRNGESQTLVGSL